MAKKKAKYLTEYPLRYPWDEWFRQVKTKRGLTITQGTDFPCQVHSMSVQFRTMASARDVSVSISISGNTLTVNIGRTNA